ncbi:DUF7504 family protein [Haloarcula halophila]|uniref:DUF7504 family protein n=1 Tax=Haloarcula TaxID=2237 RepID=UPI0023E43788|nr:hypothetical protein [Halomicroarcula sp. DFY41]
MSVTERGFAVETGALGPIPSGTSILLTGDDTDALEAVFHGFVAPDTDESSVVLATDLTGRSVQRSLDDARRQSDERSYVLTAEGRGGSNVETIDDLSDLTRLGMEFSSLVATSQQDAERFRTGILLCSELCQAVEDTRSVYRFLNSSFLTDLRRGDGIGVCALNTDDDVGGDANSIVSGLKTSFSVHIEVEKTGVREAELTVDGLPDAQETVTVSL